MQKIAIIGAGRVGESTAQFLARRDVAREIALLDVREGAAAGAALDIQETAPLLRFDTRLSGSHEPSVIAGAELVIVTAGLPRKPGMSRSDVLDKNVEILDQILQDILVHAPQSRILVVSNPVDVLTYRAWQKTGWSRDRIFGQAGVLDTSRMEAFIALETGLSTHDIQALVLGGHGDAMVPLLRYSSVNGVPLHHFMDQATLDNIVERTRHGGAEILALKQTSSAYGAPAAAIAEMVEAIAVDRRRVLPTVALLEGEYGERDVAMGVPCILGQGGMERVIELELDADERAAFDRSIAGVRKDLERLH
ncbi:MULTISPECIES: malate dehydrogenase [unclassified Thioalkalivibrio]|uniref:malate dehydrogenase n=1 Tax=unclassified Thioalkalivibrio TaxID=2621013 RepID=UPI00036E8CF7|nr:MULTISPECIES: malate dehydrogenase [unclassified Thioalkalivibrio]